MARLLINTLMLSAGTPVWPEMPHPLRIEDQSATTHDALRFQYWRLAPFDAGEPSMQAWLDALQRLHADQTALFHCAVLPDNAPSARLILQGRDLHADALRFCLDTLHLAGWVVSGPLRLGDAGERLSARLQGRDGIPLGHLTQELMQVLAPYRLDAAVCPGVWKHDHFKLLLSDMDSTLIGIECIDELADMAGLKPQVAAITERAMQGELDFAASLQARVALLKDLPASMLDRVYSERLFLNPGAETLIRGLKQREIRTGVISGGFTFFTDRLKERLGLDYAYANTLEICDGKLTGQVLGPIMDAQGKADTLKRLAEENGIGLDRCIALGDGANDLPMLREAGMGVAYHAKPVVRAQADFNIQYGGLDALLPLLPEVVPSP